MEKVYAIYDPRYLEEQGSEDFEAVCFEVCDTLKEAMQEKDEYGDGNIIVEETLEKQDDGSMLVVDSKIITHEEAIRMIFNPNNPLT